MHIAKILGHIGDAASKKALEGLLTEDSSYEVRVAATALADCKGVSAALNEARLTGG